MSDWKIKQRQDIKSSLDNLLFKATRAESARINAGDLPDEKSLPDCRETEKMLDEAQQAFLQMVYKKIESLEKQVRGLTRR